MAHRHIIGGSGVGKTTYAMGHVIEGIHDNHAICYIDPHGYDTDTLLQYIPRRRRQHTMVFDPTQFSIPWNFLHGKNIPLEADTFATAIRSAYGFTDISTANLTSVLFNTIVALMETNQNLFGLYLLLSSSKYRQFIIPQIKNEVVQRYWQALDAMPEKQYHEEIKSTINKVQVLMADPRIRAICGSRTGFDFTDIVKDKILFIRLPQGELGVEKVALLGNLLIAQIHQACLGRDITVPFDWYVDEVHNFSAFSIKEILSGVRKFNVSFTGIHQYTAQLDPTLLDSFTANATQYIFRVSLEDAMRLPKVKPQDIQLNELSPFEMVVFDRGNYSRTKTVPLLREPYKASARQIRSNLLRNKVAPAHKEIDRMLERY